MRGSRDGREKERWATNILYEVIMNQSSNWPLYRKFHFIFGVKQRGFGVCFGQHVRQIDINFSEKFVLNIPSAMRSRKQFFRLLAVSLSLQLISIITLFSLAALCAIPVKNKKKIDRFQSFFSLPTLHHQSLTRSRGGVVEWSEGMYKGIKINCFMGDVCMLFAFSLSPSTLSTCMQKLYISSTSSYSLYDESITMETQRQTAERK